MIGFSLVIIVLCLARVLLRAQAKLLLKFIVAVSGNPYIIARLPGINTANVAEFRIYILRIQQALALLEKLQFMDIFNI